MRSALSAKSCACGGPKGTSAAASSATSGKRCSRSLRRQREVTASIPAGRSERSDRGEGGPWLMRSNTSTAELPVNGGVPVRR